MERNISTKSKATLINFDSERDFQDMVWTVDLYQFLFVIRVTCALLGQVHAVLVWLNRLTPPLDAHVHAVLFLLDLSFLLD